MVGTGFHPSQTLALDHEYVLDGLPIQGSLYEGSCYSGFIFGSLVFLKLPCGQYRGLSF